MQLRRLATLALLLGAAAAAKDEGSGEPYSTMPATFAAPAVMTPPLPPTKKATPQNPENMLRAFDMLIPASPLRIKRLAYAAGLAGVGSARASATLRSPRRARFVNRV